MRRITHQRDAVEHPAADRVTVHHWIFEDKFSIRDQSGHIEPIEIPVSKRLDKILDPARRRPVIRLVVVTRLLGIPIDKLGAVLKLAYGIDHHLADLYCTDPRNTGTG